MKLQWRIQGDHAGNTQPAAQLVTAGPVPTEITARETAPILGTTPAGVLRGGEDPFGLPWDAEGATWLVTYVIGTKEGIIELCTATWNLNPVWNVPMQLSLERKELYVTRFILSTALLGPGQPALPSSPP